MRTIFSIALSLLLSMGLCGCESQDGGGQPGGSERTPRQRETGAAAEERGELNHAASLEAAGRHQEALLAYRRAGLSSPSFRDESDFGIARCLLAMDRPEPALAALEPLAVHPESAFDRERLALAGQAFLLQKRYRTAEKILSRAANGFEPELQNARWLAAAYANLGKALLENDKADEASSAYGAAAGLFAASGQRDKAATCRDMQMTIDEWLEDRDRHGY